MSAVSIEQWSQLMAAVLDQVRGSKDQAATPPAAPPITQGPTHQPVLTPEQAAAFRTLMFVQGHTGDTVGRGQVIPIPGESDQQTGEGNGEGQYRQERGPAGDGNAQAVV